jgi:hypothetical protein
MLRTAVAITLIALALCSVNRAVARAVAQQQTDAEKALADTINCKDFKRNPDGSWTGGPNAMIGAMQFSNSTVDLHGFNINGADVAVVLDQKCGSH